MKTKNIKREIKNYIVITCSAVIYAAGISLFLDPNNIAPGGLTGIAILLNRMIDVPTGTLILLLNIPLVALGIWKFGWRFILSTSYAIVVISAATDLLAPFDAVTREPILAALTGGGLVAFALGMIFRAGATTGGVDIVVKLLRLKYPYLRTGSLFMILDVAVAACSGIVFRDIEIALYAMIAIFVMSYIMDIVLYGGDEAKLIYIISDKPDEIAERILKEVDIGITYLRGEGGYSSQQKKVIMCVTKKQQAPEIEVVVKEEDPRAFMIITSASEIYGEGYKNIFADKI
ncbi:MAG: YitT family protein [Lachnospiraceae bacterium]|nr:YitT family protein [Lachnospiraceae bacterium]